MDTRVPSTYSDAYADPNDAAYRRPEHMHHSQQRQQQSGYMPTMPGPFLHTQGSYMQQDQYAQQNHQYIPVPRLQAQQAQQARQARMMQGPPRCDPASSMYVENDGSSNRYSQGSRYGAHRGSRTPRDDYNDLPYGGQGYPSFRPSFPPHLTEGRAPSPFARSSRHSEPRYPPTLSAHSNRGPSGPFGNLGHYSYHPLPGMGGPRPPTAAELADLWDPLAQEERVRRREERYRKEQREGLEWAERNRDRLGPTWNPSWRDGRSVDEALRGWRRGLDEGRW